MERVEYMKMTLFWDVATCSLVETGRVSDLPSASTDAVMMEAVDISETVISF
jgi:hypothetical protein